MNPELDRSIDGFFASVRVSDRLAHERDMLKLVTAEVPMATTIYDIRKDFQKRGVSGIFIKTGLDIINSRTWNVHEWTKE